MSLALENAELRYLFFVPTQWKKQKKVDDNEDPKKGKDQTLVKQLWNFLSLLPSIASNEKKER